MAKSYEQTVLEELGAGFESRRRRETSQCLITRSFGDDLQIGVLVNSSGSGKTLKNEVRVGVRLPSVEELLGNYVAALQRNWHWEVPRAPFYLTVWNRLSPSSDARPGIPPSQIAQEVDRICAQVSPESEVFRGQLLQCLSHATLPTWASEPSGAELVQKSLIVRSLSGDFSRESASRLVATTPNAAAYQESIDRFVDWLLAH